MNYLRTLSLVISLAVSGGACQKNDPDPNEDWVPGEDWIDVRDGQSYATVKIGGQIWMAENFNFEADSGSWVYEGDLNNASIYGRLYSWETAIYACPEGWHLPLQEEWEELTEFLGGDEVAGGTMKVRGTTLWEEPNAGATNTSGFSALPGGYRWSENKYTETGQYAYFWSSGKYSIDYACVITLSWMDGYIIDNTMYIRGTACSVRYIKN